MELITVELLDQTQTFWNLPNRSLYHEIISLIISQKISFTKSRQIRSIFFTLLGCNEFTYDNVRRLPLADHLDSTKIQNILDIPADPKLNQKYSGLGNWSNKALLIRFEPDKHPDLFLAEDLWIRKHLKNLLNLTAIPSITESRKLADSSDLNLAYLSRFFWRLKPGSIRKIKQGKILIGDDFI